MIMLGTLLVGVVIGAVAALLVVHVSVRELRSLIRQGKELRDQSERYHAKAEAYYRSAKLHDRYAEEKRAAAATHEANAEDILDKARALHTEMMT